MLAWLLWWAASLSLFLDYSELKKQQGVCLFGSKGRIPLLLIIGRHGAGCLSFLVCPC